MRLSDPGEEQPEEVVDLGDRTDGAPRVLVGRLLFNGDHRAETGYFVHIRPLHVPDELPCIGAKTFHISALALRIDRVESQGRFPASADTRNDYELVFRDADVDILKVVYPGAGYFDRFFFREKPGVGIVPGHIAIYIQQSEWRGGFAKFFGMAAVVAKKAGAMLRPQRDRFK